MERKLTEEEVWVREELTKLYPQLVINCQKTLGTAYQKHGGDLLAVCIEFFLNKPIEVQVKAFKEGKAENFITFIMGMQSKSGSSYFFQHYRRFNESIRDYYVDHYQYDIEKDDIFEFDDTMLCIKEAIKNLNPYEKMLVDAKIIRQMSYVEISETYDIPYTSLSSELKKVTKKLKSKCQHFKY